METFGQSWFFNAVIVGIAVSVFGNLITPWAARKLDQVRLWNALRMGRSKRRRLERESSRIERQIAKGKVLSDHPHVFTQSAILAAMRVLSILICLVGVLGLVQVSWMVFEVGIALDTISFNLENPRVDGISDANNKVMVYARVVATASCLAIIYASIEIQVVYRRWKLSTSMQFLEQKLARVKKSIHELGG